VTEAETQRGEGGTSPRLLEVLAQPTECDFKNTSIDKVAAYFSQRHRVPINVDAKELIQNGINTRAMVSRQRLRGVTLESALNLICDQLVAFGLSNRMLS